MKETCQEVTEDVQVDDLTEDRPSANQTGGNQSHVEEVMEKQKSEDNEEDCYCLPPMIGLAVAQFHDLGEVQSNALRICLATHRSKEAREGATKLATLIARLLQGKALEEVVALDSCLEGLDSGAHPLEEDEKITGANGNGCFAILWRVVTAVPEFNGNGFKGALSKVRLGILSNILQTYSPEYDAQCVLITFAKVVMEGGSATVAGAVAGAVFGALAGYRWN